MAKNKKVVKYPFTLNIGIVIFFIIFIYLVYNAYSFFTTTHVSPYEVVQGTIAENNIYRGLILREEQVYQSGYTGALNYYVREASRVGYGNLVCSVDENGEISDLINEARTDIGTLDRSDLAELEEEIYGFQSSYDAQNFYHVYSFKDELGSSLNEVLSLKALNSIADYAAGAQAGNTFHPMNADRPGIVVYYTDGYEGVTTETFTADMFNEASYAKNSSQNLLSVNAGDPVYKLVTSEYWNIVIPVGEALAAELAEDSAMQIRFVEDDKRLYVNYTLTRHGEQNYLILALQNSMIRYVKDRYIEVELLLNAETGLKIPNSSITRKEFFTVPTGFFLKGGDSDEEGVLVRRTDENGESESEFITPEIYYKTDSFYYIDSETVSADDVLVKSDSSTSYRVGTRTASLQGVYNINKGYAVFKQIDILYQNEEYTIVKTGTSYGIALYDHIALDGSKIKEHDLIQ